MNDNLDAIFYNPDHTKTYNPSGKPTGVVMTDFDIMEAKQAIDNLYAEKLKAFAGEVEKAIGEGEYEPDLAKEIKELMEYYKNNPSNSNKAYTSMVALVTDRDDQYRQAIKAIKERWIK